MNTDQALQILRQAARYLPAKEREQIIRRCDAIFSALQSAESKAIEDRHNVAKEIVAALLDRRVLSYKNGDEFLTSQFHTSIVEARRIIERQHPEWELCSRWTNENGGHPYKLYWVEKRLPIAPVETPTLF